MATKRILFWHRRDIRIEDNHGLSQAIQNAEELLPVFIFDTTILVHLPKNDARVSFIFQEITKLNIAYSNKLLILHGNPVELLPGIVKRYAIDAIYTNEDYEPQAIQRDQKVADKVKELSCDFITFKDHVLFSKNEVVKEDSTPYEVYTPYMKKYRSQLTNDSFKEHVIDLNQTKLVSPNKEEITLEKLGFELNKEINFPDRTIPQAIISDYHKTRDIPSIHGTTRMSLHLRFGTISIRTLAKTAFSNEKYFNELIWRDFYAMILFHFPHSAKDSLRKKYDLVEWEVNEDHFQKWCEGKTGYPIVDAGMRELNATGFMHNRVRMIVASFLCKHLLLDWRWGERYFAEKLLDFDLASNVGGWQWAAGSGVDAAPYFRIFNPYTQREKFDPDWKYVRKWVPELDTFDYPDPIVDHKIARQRALDRYKKALS